MSSERQPSESKEGLPEFFDIKRQIECEGKNFFINFFRREDRKREVNQRGMARFLSNDKNRAKNKNESIKEFRLKKEICWLFIDYFFATGSIPLRDFMDRMERNIILRTLNRVNGNQKQAAKILGLKSTTLNEKIKKFRIQLRKQGF